MDIDRTKPQQTIRIELTDEQRQQVQQATGMQARAIELTFEELEEKISLPPWA